MCPVAGEIVQLIYPGGANTAIGLAVRDLAADARLLCLVGLDDAGQDLETLGVQVAVAAIERARAVPRQGGFGIRIECHQLLDVVLARTPELADDENLGVRRRLVDDLQRLGHRLAEFGNVRLIAAVAPDVVVDGRHNGQCGRRYQPEGLLGLPLEERGRRATGCRIRRLTFRLWQHSNHAQVDTADREVVAGGPRVGQNLLAQTARPHPYQPRMANAMIPTGCSRSTDASATADWLGSTDADADTGGSPLGEAQAAICRMTAATAAGIRNDGARLIPNNATPQRRGS